MALIDSGDYSDSLELHTDKPGFIEYNSKIVGVTFEGRQEIIAMLNGDEPLRVRREPENEYDPKAVAVDVEIAETWKPIGYIAKDKNKSIAKALDMGKEVEISIASLTGGPDGSAEHDKRSYGVNIALAYPKIDAGIKDGSKVNSEPTIENSVKLNYSQEQLEGLSHDSNILAQIKALVGVKDNRTKYTSRILGKSIDVTVSPDGHVSLPGFMSGSKFPDQFYPEFKLEYALDPTIEKFWGKESEERKAQIRESILAMWDLSKNSSTGFGNAVHAAMENYDTHYVLGDKIKEVKEYKTKPPKIGPNKALSKNPFLKKIVEDFHEKFGGDYVRFSEQFIWDVEKKLCGSIDRLKIVDAEKKIVRIQDFKTDGDINAAKYQNADSPFKKLVANTLLGLHQLQLSFYAYILKQYGYTVEGLDIYWLNPAKLVTGENAWEEFKLEVIDIEGAL